MAQYRLFIIRLVIALYMIIHPVFAFFYAIFLFLLVLIMLYRCLPMLMTVRIYAGTYFNIYMRRPAHRH